MRIVFVIMGILVFGVVSFPRAVSAQAGENDSAAEIQKITLQSQKLMAEYKQNKQKIEDALQQKLRALTNDPGDRARRRQWMEETNQKLSALKHKFSDEMEVVNSTRRDLLDNPSTESGSRKKKKGFSAEELKKKITMQEDQIREEMEESSQKQGELPKENDNVPFSKGGNQENESIAPNDGKYKKKSPG